MKTIGVIGLGSMGMRHAKNLRAMGHHVWGVDPDMSARLEFGFDYTAPKIEHIIGSADAVIIASPTSLHQEQYMELVINDGGATPVFMEKPVSHVYDVMFKNVTMVGYNLRFHSCVKKAREWLPTIGEPLWANLTCAQLNDKPAYKRDGVILNWSHEIDLACYLLGPASHIASSTVLENRSDILTDILLQHENGCQSLVHLDYVTQPEIRQTVIIGSRGGIILDLVNRQAWLRDLDGGVTEHWAGDDDWNDNYIEEMQAFIDRIDGKDTIGCSGEEGLKVLEVCLAARKQAGLS